jgi:redox-sensitive bicupin YhaK (pirin superfamily)
MLLIRRAKERGVAKHDWLQSYHTFSFADYYDPDYMGFENLRVINEDVIAAGKGFATHKHHDMEILTYVIDGLLEHKDSMGNGSQIRPGEIQIMSAGSGVSHSEFNASPDKSLHLLQIWILPNQKGLLTRYDQKTIDHTPNQLIPIAAPLGSPAAVVIHQNVIVYAAYCDKDVSLSHILLGCPAAWLQVVKGNIDVNQENLVAGDGMAIKQEEQIKIFCREASEFLIFEFL